MFGAGAAAQLTHPKETSIEEDMRLLTAWSNGVAAATTATAAAAAEEMKQQREVGKSGEAMLPTERGGGGQQQQTEDGSGLLPSGRMIAILYRAWLIACVAPSSRAPAAASR